MNLSEVGQAATIMRPSPHKLNGLRNSLLYAQSKFFRVFEKINFADSADPTQNHRSTMQHLEGCYGQAFPILHKKTLPIMAAFLTA